MDLTSPHALRSANSSLLIVLVLVCLGFGALIRRWGWKFLPESAGCILVGFVVGIGIHFSSAERASLVFSPDIVFFALLPPIILDAGYTLSRNDFFANLGSISLLAVLGTMLNNILFGYALLGLASGGLVPLASAPECLLFGAVISATDPVATLAVLGSKEVDAHPLLYTLVFGESVLNDAISMVLFRVFRAYVPWDDEGEAITGESSSSVGVGEVLSALVMSVAVALASVVFGVCIGLAGCFLMKRLRLEHAPVYEVILVGSFAILSYTLADFFTLSGVMALFFCAVTLAHFNYWNLCIEGQLLSLRGFKSLSHCADTFVFAYIGLAAGTMVLAGHDGAQTDVEWSGGLVFWTIVLCVVARAAHVFPLLFIANKTRSAETQIPLRMSCALWMAGLRGPVSLMLSFDFPGPARGVVVTSTLVLVLFSTFVGGGLTIPMLRLTGMHGAGKGAARDLLHDQSNGVVLEDDRLLQVPPTPKPNKSKPRMTRKIMMEGGESGGVDAEIPSSSAELEVDGSAPAASAVSTTSAAPSSPSPSAVQSPSFSERLSLAWGRHVCTPDLRLALARFMRRWFGGRPSSREISMGRFMQKKDETPQSSMGMQPLSPQSSARVMMAAIGERRVQDEAVAYGRITPPPPPLGSAVRTGAGGAVELMTPMSARVRAELTAMLQPRSSPVLDDESNASVQIDDDLSLPPLHAEDTAEFKGDHGRSHAGLNDSSSGAESTWLYDEATSSPEPDPLHADSSIDDTGSGLNDDAESAWMRDSAYLCTTDKGDEQA